MNPLHSKGIRLLTAAGLVFGIYANAVPVRVSEAPSNDLEMTLAAIDSANKTIIMNAYELSSIDIGNAIIAKVKSGVAVSILEEGQPVGGISKPGQALQQRIVDAMNNADGCHFFLMTSKVKAKRRYRFDHAKYAVIDGTDLLIGSENYSPTGNPATGAVGNRGWEVVITDAILVKQYQDTFKIDSDMSHSDVMELTDNRAHVMETSGVAPLAKFLGGMLPLAPSGDRTLLDSLPNFDAVSVDKITSPDTSLKGLVGLLDSAKTTIDLEQMTFAAGWASQQSTSPLYEAVVRAAQRGVTIRVLVNDDRVFGGTDTSKLGNFILVDKLNAEAKAKHLSVEARIADIKAMGVDYIHNKGALVDGTQTLISSINWNSNSVTNNREAAVVINSQDINVHYSNLFNSDWNNSEKAN